eukprot:305004-Rhodomonas_salina.2
MEREDGWSETGAHQQSAVAIAMWDTSGTAHFPNTSVDENSVAPQRHRNATRMVTAPWTRVARGQAL